MPRSFSELRSHLAWGRLTKDPKGVARLVIGGLLLANIIAGYMVVSPVGGSAEDLEEQLLVLRQQAQQRQLALQRLRSLVAKIESARTSGDDFQGNYFMGRRTASSAIVTELNQAAKQAGIRPKDHAFAFEPLEGSDTLSMMTVVGSYEGTYGDLLQFVNRLDKSPRFLILDTLTAAPQQAGGNLNVTVKLNTFVREDRPAT